MLVLGTNVFTEHTPSVAALEKKGYQWSLTWFTSQKKKISAVYKELISYYKILLCKSVTVFDANENIDPRVKWKV